MKDIKGKVIITTTFKNTIVTIVDEYDNLIAWNSTLESGKTSFDISIIIVKILKRIGITNIEIIIREYSDGVEEALKGFENSGLNIKVIYECDISRKLRRHN